MLYFAYGMNTNVAGMAQRCPAAISLGRAQLLGHRFRFAGPADVQRDRRYNVEGVLWNITEECLASLDALEGYPYFYNRSERMVCYQGLDYPALVYHMQPGNRNAPPSSGYFSMLLEGYEEHQVSTHQLWQAANVVLL